MWSDGPDPDAIDTRFMPLAEKLHSIERRLFPKGSFRRGIIKRLVMPAARSVLKLPGRAVQADARLAEIRIEEGVLPDPKEICVVQLAYIGDHVMCLPAVRFLREQFPRARVTLVCATWNVPFSGSTGLFDEIIGLDLVSAVSGEISPIRHYMTRPPELERLRHFDLAIDLQHDPEFREVLVHVGAGFRAGFHASRLEGALDMMFPRMVHRDWRHPARAVPMPDLQVALVAAVAARYLRHSRQKSFMDSVATASPLLPPGRPRSRKYVVGIGTGCGTETRKWPVGMFMELAHRLVAERDAYILLLGGPLDVDDATSVARSLPIGSSEILAGTRPLSAFAGDARMLDVYVGNDTGPTHLAAAAGVSTVCVFTGVGPLARHACKGRDTTVIAVDVPCASCGFTKVAQCPNDFVCARGVTVDAVFRAVCLKLDATASGV